MKDSQQFAKWRLIFDNGEYTEREGKGLLELSSGIKRQKQENIRYVGAFKGMAAKGQGTVIWENLNCRWTGTFRNDKFRDEGTLTFPDGRK